MPIRPVVFALAVVLMPTANTLAETLIYEGFGSTGSSNFVGHEPANPIGLTTLPPWPLPTGNWSQPEVWGGQFHFNFGYFKFFPAATDQTLTGVPFHVELNFLSDPSGGSSLPSASGLLITGVLNGTVHGGHDSQLSDSYPTVTAQVTSVARTLPLGVDSSKANVWGTDLPFPLDAVHVDLAPFAMNQDRTSIPISVDIAAVIPEPSTVALFVGALGAMMLRRRIGRSLRPQN